MLARQDGTATPSLRFHATPAQRGMPDGGFTPVTSGKDRHRPGIQGPPAVLPNPCEDRPACRVGRRSAVWVLAPDRHRVVPAVPR
jgi:hypothetical protein